MHPSQCIGSLPISIREKFVPGGVKSYIGLVRNLALTSDGDDNIWAVTPVKSRRRHAHSTRDDSTASSVTGVTIFRQRFVIKHG